MGEKNTREKIYVCNTEKEQLEKYIDLKKLGYDVKSEWRFNKRCVIAKEKK